MRLELLGLSMHVAPWSSGMEEFERGMWDVVEKESGGEKIGIDYQESREGISQELRISIALAWGSDEVD